MNCVSEILESQDGTPHFVLLQVTPVPLNSASIVILPFMNPDAAVLGSR